eukprot:1169056-Prymnesium_polylepis.1
MARAALLLRMADVTAYTEIVQRSEGAAGGAVDEGAPQSARPVVEQPPKVKDRLHVRFSNAQLVVARGVTTLDEHWMVRETYQPTHWVLPDIQIHLIIEQKLPPTPSLPDDPGSAHASSARGEAGSGRPPSDGWDDAPRAPELHLHLTISPIVLSLACTECVFVLALLQEQLPVFFPPDERRPPPGAAAGDASPFGALSRERAGGVGDTASEADEGPQLVRDDL